MTSRLLRLTGLIASLCYRDATSFHLVAHRLDSLEGRNGFIVFSNFCKYVVSKLNNHLTQLSFPAITPATSRTIDISIRKIKDKVQVLVKSKIPPNIAGPVAAIK